MPTIIAASGALIALINSGDAHHEWAVEKVRPLPKPWIVCRAALIETTHHFKNHPRVLEELIGQVAAFNIEDPEPVKVMELMRRYAPAMDYADACAVLLWREHKTAMVVTTDHRDFSTYKVPFMSPKGTFRRDVDESP